MPATKILPTVVLASVVILVGGAIPSSAAHPRSGSLGPHVAPASYVLGSEVQISPPPRHPLTPIATSLPWPTIGCATSTWWSGTTSGPATATSTPSACRRAASA